MRWVLKEPSEPDPILLALAGGNRFLAAMLARRGLQDAAAVLSFTDPDHFQPSAGEILPGMEAGLEVIGTAIREGKMIAVWGDFDVDGQTAATVLVSGLRALGAEVIFHIPVREYETHGLNQPELDGLISAGAGVLVTCDTGISAHEEIAYARSQGLRVVITDHHDLPEILPDAEAVINPKMIPNHSLGSLPGVGVAYKLIEALFIKFERQYEVDQFLDLVALGIVADVANVTGDCRYLLQRGLEELRKGNRLAIRKMCEYAGLEPGLLSEDDIGFQLGPRMNSLGRLGDANGMVGFLTSNDEEETQVFALMLEGTNNKRRFLTEQALQSALEMVEKDRDLKSDPALVLYNEHWHPGVIGIVASKLTELFHKPAVLITRRGEDLAGGSARSVNGCDISQAIAACSEVLLGFGGHQMAAGMSLYLDQLPEFKARLLKKISLQLGTVTEDPELEVEMIVSLADVQDGLTEAVRTLAPFGPGNPAPVFGCRDVRLVSSTNLGKNGLHRRLIVEDSQEFQHGILWWEGGAWELPDGSFDLAFTVTASQFRGKIQVQLVLEDFLAKSDASQKLDELEVIDLRNSARPELDLNRWSTGSDSQIWAEGVAVRGVEGVNRAGLASHHTLVIWTTPHSFWAMQQALQIVKPKKVVVVFRNPPTEKLGAFLQHTAGMVKFAIQHRQGEIDLHALAAGLGQSVAAARLGLDWLEAKEICSIVDDYGDRLVVREGHAVRVIVASMATIERDLQRVLRESAAFRATVRRQDARSLREELRQMAN